MGTITARLPEDLDRDIEEVAKTEQLDKSTVMRRLLTKSVGEWKAEHALEQYTKRKLSFRQAPHPAALSVWQFNDLLLQRKIPRNYDMAELRRDIETAKQWKR